MEQNNLSLYKIFYEVARTQNISRAAKELYISQPAISKSISRLEESLGTALFVRNSRGVQLTDEGKILYEHTKAAFDALGRGEKELERIRELGIGQIRIGVSTTVCKYLLVPYLRDYIEQSPHVKITIESQDSAKTLEMLEQGHIDVGLVAEPKSKKNLDFYPIKEIQDAFVATKKYLTNLSIRENHPSDLFKVGNIMLLDRSNLTRNFIDDYFIEHQIEPNHLLEVTTMDLLIEFAKIGMGIGGVIRDFVMDELESGALVEIPLEFPLKKRTIGFAYMKNAGLPNAVLNFIQYYKDHSPA